MNLERKLFSDWLKKQPDYLEISGYEKIIMFKAWKASVSASREGYKMVPVEPSFETMQNMNMEFINSEFDTPKRRMQLVYQAMIGAVE